MAGGAGSRSTWFGGRIISDVRHHTSGNDGTRLFSPLLCSRQSRVVVMVVCVMLDHAVG